MFSLGALYYILWLISLLYSSYANGWALNNRLSGSRLLLYALLLIIGIAEFGWPVHR